MRLFLLNGFFATSLLIISSASAQESTYLGQLAESAAGQVGQRQTAGNSQAHIEPLGRLNNRIANRVQNRIRNRIDRYYDPRANTTSPFEVAAEQNKRLQSPR
ncbi:hypothetical protein GS397_26800 (plasmid) [Sphingobium yanoikuyae]|uniref:Uncharacterized protein n=1 Tax=Sphingobium yanoikuyae TaxID=13690 RepID=A0A6P1GQD2_SPHYA|nr:hypothetical protein [Sphingobium yanoikuyae]QHD70719.1 hypothetical protein GS397_26800 [Sphingobium yanoikuyae]